MLYGWKVNSMFTNCLAACAHLTISVSVIERDICKKNRHFIIPPCIRWPRRNIGTPFGVEKIEWCRYPMVKKFRRYVYSFWRDQRTWRTDGQTDRHRVTAIAALCIASHGNKRTLSSRQQWRITVEWEVAVRRTCSTAVQLTSACVVAEISIQNMWLYTYM